MRKLAKNVPTLYFPDEPPEVVAQRKAKNDRIFKMAEMLGVDLTCFDSENDGLFKNKKEQVIYERDCLALSLLLNKGEPLPQDLIDRLLTIKERRERLKKEKKK